MVEAGIGAGRDPAERRGVGDVEDPDVTHRREVYGPHGTGAAGPGASAPEHPIRVFADQQPPGLEPLQGVAGDVDGGRRAIEDQLGEAQPDRPAPS